MPGTDAITDLYNLSLNQRYTVLVDDGRIAASGDQAVIAAVAGKKITVVGLVLHVEESAAGSETYIFKSATTAILAQFIFGPGKGIVLGVGDVRPYLMQTAAGAALNVNLANGYGTHLIVSYILV